MVARNAFAEPMASFQVLGSVRHEGSMQALGLDGAWV